LNLFYVVLEYFDKLGDDRAFYTEFFASLCLDHGPDDLHVSGDVDSWAVKLVKIVHRLGLSISSNDYFDIFGEVLW
jgi:hypothetical protein